MRKKRVCVLGLGYIGLPTSALLAMEGHDVLGVDVNKKAVETINQGKVHIIEKDLDAFVQNAVQKKKLTASEKPDVAGIFIIAVPTPFHKGHVPNVDYINAAVRSIAPFVKKEDLIILESTSPVGTTRNIKNILEQEGVDISSVSIAHCPERVLPGHIMKELVENDRIVGGVDEASTAKAVEFYKSFVKGDVLETNAETAEMAKLTENSFRDVNIAFANELSILCDRLGIDVWEVIKLANKHPRVEILRPGPGVGGHCIAVDPWFIVHKDKEFSKIIKTAREVNDYKTDWVIEKIENLALKFEKDNNKKPRIACLGLAFKPDIDDLRESPSLEIAKGLIKRQMNVVAVEPNIDECDSTPLVGLDDALEKSDITVCLVGHKEFKDIPMGKIDYDFCGLLQN